MNNNVLKLALSDFNLNKESYNILSRLKIKQITNEVVKEKPNDKTLLFSQQILLSNKKHNVTFDKI